MIHEMMPSPWSYIVDGRLGFPDAEISVQTPKLKNYNPVRQQAQPEYSLKL
jgi:hypothetical protein